MNAKRISLLFVIGGVMVLRLSAQTAATAAGHFDNRRYVEAAHDYAALLERNPRNNLYLYRYARCLHELGDSGGAIRYFEAAGEKYPLRNYYLALLYYDAYRFSEAEIVARKYKETLPTDDGRQLALQSLLDSIETAQSYFRRIEAVQIIDSVVVDKDRFLSVYQISPEAGHLQPDTLGVCYTNQRNDRKHFTRVLDSSLCLFASQKLLDRWSTPRPLPAPVNTASDQNYPYILSDGITLYYASKGRGSLGGYDIFFTRYNSTTGTYLNPENAGMPFNSPANDYMMVIDEYSNIGWFATDRFQPEGKVAVYSFVPRQEKQYVDISHPDTLRRYARLELYEQVERSPIQPLRSSVAKEPSAPLDADDGFLVAAGQLYRSESDFHNPEAREQYRAYMRNNDTIMQLDAHIRQLRNTYVGLPSDEKTELAAVIVAAENRLYTLRQEIRKQENEIRQKEMGYLQNVRP